MIMDALNLSLELNESELFQIFANSVYQINSTTAVPAPPLAHTILLGLALGCIILVTICGNVLVLLAVYVNSHLRSTTNYFIVNLAVADLLLGITVLPFSATLETLKYWPFGYLICNVWASADVLWCTASIWTLCVISIDRYVGVTRPLQHSTIITERRAGYIIMGVWILSVAISIAPLIGWKEQGSGDSECTVTKQVGYVIFSVSGSFYIPMFIIVVVYAKIYREATKHSKFLNCGMKPTKIDQHNGVVLRIHIGRNSQPNIHHYQSSSSSEHSEGSGRKLSSKFTLAGKIAKFKMEKKAAKTLGIVVGVFIVCWLPFFFCLPLDVLCGASCRVPDQLFTAIFWLGYCNSLMNPIIYASSSKEFKRAFVRVIRCQYRRKPRRFMNGRATSMTELRHYGLAPYNSAAKCAKMPQTFPPKQYSQDDLLDTNFCLTTRSLDSPMMSLRVFQDRRKLSSNSSNGDRSESRSSFSEIVDEELAEIINGRTHGKRASHGRDATRGQIGSFAKDENYINVFRNMTGQTIL